MQLKLNTQQFLASLHGVDKTLTVKDGIVTFENGDTYDVAAQAVGQTQTVLCRCGGGRPGLKTVLPQSIKILVSSFEEGLAVQRALISLGCGSYVNPYTLGQTLQDEHELSGIIVHINGVLQLVRLNDPCCPDEVNSRERMAQSPKREVSVSAVLAAKSISDLAPTDAAP
jgi:hypothetical protein